VLNKKEKSNLTFARLMKKNVCKIKKSNKKRKYRRNVKKIYKKYTTEIMHTI